jgi:diacylglycerol kinase (ATP)
MAMNQHNNKNRRDVVSSFNNAMTGLLYIVKEERNFRIHLVFGFLVISMSLFLKVPLSEFLILLLVIGMVLFAEIINTVIEKIVDVFTDKYHTEARKAKDIAASAVFITAIWAFITGYLILVKYFPEGWRNIFTNIAESPWYLSFISLVLVILLALIMKYLFSKKVALAGGMPSIHSVMAFSIWTAISIFTFHEVPVISLLVFILAFWVAQGRVLKGIHKIIEVVVGGIIGILFTSLIFQLFWRH